MAATAAYTKNLTVPSDVPAFIRAKILTGQEAEFYRYGQVISDPANPITGLQVVTNHAGAGEYFGELMNRLGIPGDVSVLSDVG